MGPIGEWRPTKFVRFEKSIGTSTQPALIVTDAGRAVVKVINNPLGPQVLARDYIGTSLARLFGLRTFDFAILNVKPDDEIFLYGNVTATPGPAFSTRYEQGFEWGGSEDELRDLENVSDLAPLIVFDTWVRNRDRHPPPNIQWGLNTDNVYLSIEGITENYRRLLAIDHTECFAPSIQDLNNQLASNNNIRDIGIYGLFREFVTFITPEGINEAVNRLKTVDTGEIQGIINNVPGEWELTPTGKQDLMTLLTERAHFLSGNLLERLSEDCWPNRLIGI